MNTLEQIRKIEEEAKQKVDALRDQAKSELVRQIAAKKEELAALEAKYIELTGKNFKGEAIPRASKRVRINSEQRMSLIASIESMVKNAVDGISTGEIVSRLNQPANLVRELLKESTNIRREGNRSSTRYHFNS